MAEDKKKEIAVIEITEEYMKDRLYEFRGKKVMLDSDLAEIYGYETKNFKRQVKNNIAKFEGDDFMFELNDIEDGIDSSKEAGKLLISIIAAVANRFFQHQLISRHPSCADVQEQRP